MVATEERDAEVKSKLVDDSSQKTYVLIFETGDDPMKGLLSFAKENGITAAHFTGIGAFQDATLGYFAWEKKDYLRNPVNEQVEVVSLAGDIATEKGQPKVHAHVAVGKRDGSTMSGHLLEAHVRPTLEVVLQVSPAHLQREMDPESGLALIRI